MRSARCCGTRWRRSPIAAARRCAARRRASRRSAATARIARAAKILAHIGDLYDWALTQAKGAEAWNDSTPLEWDREVERFFAALQRFDDYLASDAPLAATPERLFQGAIADSLTHVGQLAMLRRLAGARMKSENYSRADIVAGRVGPEQTAPKREFD